MEPELKKAMIDLVSKVTVLIDGAEPVSGNWSGGVEEWVVPQEDLDDVRGSLAGLKMQLKQGAV